MTEELLVLGAGGHGKVVADAAMEMGYWSSIGFVDDRCGLLQQVLGLPMVGQLSDLKSLRAQWSAAAVAIGDARRRLEVLDIIEDLGFDRPIIAHPSAVISRFATVAAGTVVFAQAVINAGAEIGAGCIVNTGATIDHDCRLGEGVHVCPGANLAGDVTVGARSWIGIGATVRQGISIGRDVLVGAGSVVVDNLPDGITVYGVPARQRPASERD
jgi:sugar O-acyltransferase (sialic acid O-acetyltransferase NeuD family)